MRFTGSRFGIAVLLVLALSGCQGVPKDDSTTAVSAAGDQQASYVAEAGLSNEQRLRQAIRLLESGQSGQAGAELKRYLENIPDSKIARGLLRQIEVPIADYYPAEYTVVDLADGDSLSTIAKQYLGDPLQFYALARYNDIANPKKTDIGQTIRIPMTVHAKTIVSALGAKRDSETAKGDERTPDTVKGGKEDSSSVASLPDEFNLTGVELLSVLLADKDYYAAVQAYELLESTENLSARLTEEVATAYAISAKALVSSDPLRAADYYQRGGDLILKTGDQVTALQWMSAGVELNQQNEVNKAAFFNLRKQVTDAYHREASSAFRQQELDKAIALWQQVLKIDPAHGHANTYLLQAQELKAKLERFDE